MSNKFVKGTKTKQEKKLFEKIIQYVIICYQKLAIDNQNNEPHTFYSRQFCQNQTSFKFEDFLKIKLVEDYLQTNKEEFGIGKLKDISFQYETQKTYQLGGKTFVDKIDIFVSNLPLKGKVWGSIDKDKIYFAIECKILKNNSNNSEYIKDIVKFVEREYETRFPLEGMIGFLEKSSKTIDKIMEDIKGKLASHSKLQTNQNLQYRAIEPNFEYSYLSKHQRQNPNIEIEVYHLILNYSRMILP